MGDKTTIPYETLNFFGQMNVHLTHELQNVMATISETSGLLNDLAEFAASGGKVDEARTSRLMARIVDEAERGHKLVSRINSLAHSADEPAIRLDLARVIRFMAEASGCMPKARTVELDVEDEVMEIKAGSYYVEQLLYGCLRAAFRGLKPEERIKLSAGRHNGDCRVVFSGLAADPGEEGEEAFPCSMTASAAGILGAEVSLDRGAGRLAVRLPLAG